MKRLHVETEQESDGRWIAEVVEVAGAMAYGESRHDAIAKAEAIAFRVLADRLEHGELDPEEIAFFQL
jgi:predicted RNase H-like HicB family nuclease